MHARQKSREKSRFRGAAETAVGVCQQFAYRRNGERALGAVVEAQLLFEERRDVEDERRVNVVHGDDEAVRGGGVHGVGGGGVVGKEGVADGGAHEGGKEVCQVADDLDGEPAALAAGKAGLGEEAGEDVIAALARDIAELGEERDENFDKVGKDGLRDIMPGGWPCRDVKKGKTRGKRVKRTARLRGRWKRRAR